MLHCCSAVVIMKGRAYVGVTSTGIFCRLTCGARKPKSQNCQFFGGVSECLSAGFRACKRCRPLDRLDQTDPGITRLLDLLDLLDAQPMHRWNEATLAQMGRSSVMVAGFRASGACWELNDNIYDKTARYRR